jgi:hypothetical protein
MRCPKPQSGAVRKSLGPPLSLADAVLQTRPHIVEQEIGIELDRLVSECRDRRIAGIERARVAKSAADAAEEAWSRAID